MMYQDAPGQYTPADPDLPHPRNKQMVATLAAFCFIQAVMHKELHHKSLEPISPIRARRRLINKLRRGLIK